MFTREKLRLPSPQCLLDSPSGSGSEEDANEGV